MTLHFQHCLYLRMYYSHGDTNESSHGKVSISWVWTCSMKEFHYISHSETLMEHTQWQGYLHSKLQKNERSEKIWHSEILQESYQRKVPPHEMNETTLNTVLNITKKKCEKWTPQHCAMQVMPKYNNNKANFAQCQVTVYSTTAMWQKPTSSNELCTYLTWCTATIYTVGILGQQIYHRHDYNDFLVGKDISTQNAASQ